jgi:nucleotide-binding universal stress UspA family protein
MFNRFLVAIDESEAGTRAETFARDAARQFAASVRVVTVAGGRMVSDITEAAARFGADVIVLGLAPERMANHRFTRGVQQKVTRASSLPVLMAPPVPAGNGDV